MTLPSLGNGRILVAFGEPDFWALSPTWVTLDDQIGVTVAGYSIDRGRQIELDRTDTGRATVDLFDTTGILDPENTASPFHGDIQPLIQIAIQRLNPMTDVWHTRFRGWVETWDWSVDRSQKVNRVRIEAVDIFEVLANIELTVDDFSDPHLGGGDEDGAVVFEEDTMGLVIKKVLGRAGVPSGWRIVFSGNVALQRSSFSAGEDVLSCIQTMADAELPSVANVYADRIGRCCTHGRLSKRSPEIVVATITDPNFWDWSRWKAGDLAAVEADVGQVAQLREFGYQRGTSAITNSAFCTPYGIDPNDIAGQVYTSAAADASIARYGLRSWSAENLWTGAGLEDSSHPLVETKRFAEWRVENYCTPRNRTTAVGFRSIQPDRVGSGITWELLSELDISDQLTLYVGGVDGHDGGMDGEVFFVEGVHEIVRPGAGAREDARPDWPARSGFDDVTLNVDISPRSLYDHWPFPDVTDPDVDPS